MTSMVSSRSSGLTGKNDSIVIDRDNERDTNSCVRENCDRRIYAKENCSRINETVDKTNTETTNVTDIGTNVGSRINDDDVSSFESEEKKRIKEESYRDQQRQQHERTKEISKSQSGPSSLSITKCATNFVIGNIVSNRSNSDSSESSINVDNKIVDNNASEVFNDYSETEENYEGFGYVRTNDGDLGLDVDQGETDRDESLGGRGLGGDGSSSAPSPTGPNSLSLKSTSPSSTIGRHSWLRTSLRRTPPCTSRQRQLGSNALASQLYRSGSFNSSGRGSNCDAADDMYSDVSLEDDVIDLNNRVRMLQDQMHVLTDTRSVGDERYARVKQENATLQARILMLEEAAKDAEARAEEKLEMEQRRHREWACRLEREKQLQLENYAIKMQTIELEGTSLRDQIGRLREQLESTREDRDRLDNVIHELRRETSEVREAERQALLRANEARVLLDAAKEELAIRVDERLRIDELVQEVEKLRARNKNLEESRDELQAAAALQAGRELLMLNLPRSGYDNLHARDEGDGNGGGPIISGGACSLAVELSADSLNDVNSSSRLAKQPTTMSEMRQALKEQQEVNAQLRSYIDGILLNIVENHPQLLEVKQQANGC